MKIRVYGIDPREYGTKMPKKGIFGTKIESRIRGITVNDKKFIRISIWKYKKNLEKIYLSKKFNHKQKNFWQKKNILFK